MNPSLNADAIVASKVPPANAMCQISNKEGAAKVRAVPFWRGTTGGVGKLVRFLEAGLTARKISPNHGKITRRPAARVNVRQAFRATDVALLVRLQNPPRRWQAHCVTVLRTFERGIRKRLEGGSGRASYRKGEDLR
jgi:hypothetical protein